MTWVDYLAFDCVLYCKPHCALYCAFYCISYCEYLRLTGRASQGLVVVVIRPCYTCQRTGYNTAFASPFLMLFSPHSVKPLHHGSITVTSPQRHGSITVTSPQHHHPITLRHTATPRAPNPTPNIATALHSTTYTTTLQHTPIPALQRSYSTQNTPYRTIKPHVTTPHIPHYDITTLHHPPTASITAPITAPLTHPKQP